MVVYGSISTQNRNFRKDFMKSQIMKKRISIFLCASLLMSFLWGCSQNTVTDSAAELKPIGEPPVSMKEVTQDDKDSWSTFHLQIPEDWVCVPDALSGIYVMSENSYNRFNEEIEQQLQGNNQSWEKYDFLEYDWERKAAYFLDHLSMFVDCTKLAGSEEEKKNYEQLFQGNTDVFEESRIEFLIQYQKLQNKLEDMDPDSQWNPSEIADSIPEVTPEEKAAFPKPTYEYAYYNGTKGKIVEVKGTYTWNDTTYTIVEYYREDIPCVVFGSFGDSKGLSSGDIALWVADSLEVEEHF